MHINKRIISRALLLSLIISNFVNPLVSSAESIKTQTEMEKLQKENTVSATLTGEQILEDMKKQEENTEKDSSKSEKEQSNNAEKEQSNNAEKEQSNTAEKEQSNTAEKEQSNEEVKVYNADDKDYETMPIGTYDNAIDYYNSHPGGYMEYIDGSFYYGTRMQAASSSTRYRTIGYQISVEREGFLFYDRIQIGGTVKKLDERQDGGYSYVLYKMDVYNGESLISRMQSRHGHNDVLERIIYPDQVTDFEFNPIFTIVEGSASTIRGSVDWYGNLSGEVYLTAKGTTSVDSSGKHLVFPSGYSWSLNTSYDSSKGGINGARGWGQPAKDSQASAFNKRSQIYGNTIPAWRQLEIRHIAEESGSILASSTYTGLNVYRSTGDVYVAPLNFSGREVSASQTVYGNEVQGRVSRSGGFNVPLRKVVHYQRVDIYYRLQSKVITVGIGHIDQASGVYLTPDEFVYPTVGTNGLNYRFYPKNTDEYKVVGVRKYENGNLVSEYSVNRGTSYVDVHIPFNGGNYQHVTFVCNRSIPSDTAGSGTINFGPSSTGWVNSNINVQITASGNTRITRYGTANRTLYYGTHLTVPSTTVEVWEIDKIYVWGNASNVGYGSATLNNGGTFTISADSINGELGAKVSSWKRVSTSWLHSYPVGTSGVYAVTGSPGHTYESYSKAKANGGTYNLDKTRPSLWVNKNSQDWTNQSVNVVLSSSDNLSGVQLNNGNASAIRVEDDSHYNKADYWPAFNSNNITIPLTTDGIWKIYSTIHDHAWNKQEIVTGQYKIDKTKPTATVDKSSQYWTNQNIPIKVTHSDNLAGVYSATTTLTDSSGTSSRKSYADISPSITIMEEGIWTLSTTYNDRASNSNSNTWGTYSLDKTKPQSTIDKTSQNWTNKDINLKITHTDNLSGVETATTQIVDTSYKPSQTYNSSTISPSMTINRDGIWRVYTTPTDRAKNTNPTNWAYYHLDKTLPNDPVFSKDNRQYIDDNLDVTITVGDNLSGLSEVKYVVNNSPTDRTGTQVSGYVTTDENSNQTKSFKVSLNKTGSYYIHVYTKDRAGNEKWFTSQNYKIIRLNPNDAYIYPRAKGVRGTRFDILVGIDGVTKNEVSTNKVMVNVTNLPNWFNDAVNKKDANNKYTVTTGTQTRLLKLYAAKSTGNHNVADSTSKTTVYESTVIPFGTTPTMDRNGARLRTQEKFNVKLTLDPSFYHVTQCRPIDLYYDIVPEVDLKTEVISNNL